MHVRILADDLTGAADAAIGFAVAGRRPLVRLAPPAAGGKARADVVSHDLDCRDCRPEAARPVLAAAIGAACAAEGIVFVKIDSTLRGPVETAISLLAERRGDAPVIVTPAFPELGRRLANGRLVLAETLPGRAPPDAVGFDLAGRLARTGIGHVSLPAAAVRSGTTATAAAFANALRTAPVLLVDAERRADIDAIVAGAFEVSPSPRFAGSGGLSTSLCRHLFGAAADDGGAEAPTDRGPGLWLIGSAAGTAHRQAAALARTAGVRPIAAPSDDTTATTAAARAALRAGDDALVFLPPPTAGARLQAGLLNRLVAVGRALAGEAGWLYLSGGATARAVLEALGIAEFDLIRAPFPGVAEGLATLAGRPLPLVLKAGSFQGDGNLVAIRAGMTGRQR